jgi:hypothetical protein
MIYLVLYVALILSVLMAAGRSPSTRALVGVWATFLLVFVGLRRWVGCDFTSYMHIWKFIQFTDANEAIQVTEPGFAVLTLLLQYMELEYYTVNLVAAAVFMFGLKKFAHRHPNPLAIIALSFPILIIHLAMSGVRQAIAIGFIMLAIGAFLDRRRLAFLLFVLLAASFHYSALLFLPLLAAINRSPSLHGLALAYLVAVGLISYAAPASVEVYQTRYLVADGAGPVATGGPVRALLVTVAGLLFFCLLRRPWQQKFPSDYNLTRFLAVFTMLLLPISAVSTVIGDRVAYYLMPTQLAIFARVPYLGLPPSLSRLVSVAPYLLLLGFLIAWLYASPLVEVCYLPYDNYLFGGDALRAW